MSHTILVTEKTHSEIVKELTNVQKIAYELNQVCDSICQVFKNDVLKTKVTKLQKAVVDIASWADEYNFEYCPANGYISLLKIGVKLGSVCIKSAPYLDNPKVEKDISNLLEIALIAVDVLQKLREDSVTFNASESKFKSLQASSLEMFVKLFSILLRIDNETIAPAYGTYCGFWLTPWSQLAAIVIISGLSILSSNFFDGVRCLFDSNYRGTLFANLIKSADINFVMKLRTFLHSPLYTKLLPLCFYGTSVLASQDIFVSRQYFWLITENNQKITKNYVDKNQFRSGKKIRCKIYKGTEKTKKDQKLIFYCHGGGFVTGTPESQEVFIRDWAKKLDVPILSVDYTLSPEAKFPVALQEVLDVYLWIISENSEVEQTLGYKPKSIVLIGDSAGGNLCASLTIVLNDIKKSDSEFNVIMPKSLICLYAPFNLTLLLSPSMVLAACDSLLSAGVMLSCFEAYIPSFDNPKNDETYRLINCFTSFGGLKDFVLGFLKNFKRFSANGEVTLPWYRAEEKELIGTVKKLFEITSNPYISPLFYDDFDSLSKVSLHLVSLHFDPFLDDSVTMAHKWQGKTTLEVFEGLQHGFLNFLPFSQEAERVSNRVMEYIKQDFEL